MRVHHFMLYMTNIHHWRIWIFGTTMYPYLKHYNDTKFQLRTSVCVFLGYASKYKGVICYNLQSNKLILSRHVLYDESIFPAKSTSQVPFVITHSSSLAASQSLPIMSLINNLQTEVRIGFNIYQLIIYYRKMTTSLLHLLWLLQVKNCYKNLKHYIILHLL